MSLRLKRKKGTFVKLETKFIFYIYFFRKVVLVELRMHDIPEG